jgi:hypothetical protein
MDALESHFKETFTKKADRPRLGDEWFNGVKKISRLHEGAPRETKNKDQPYKHHLQRNGSQEISWGGRLVGRILSEIFWEHLVDDLHQSISHGIEKRTLSD